MKDAGLESGAMISPLIMLIGLRNVSPRGRGKSLLSQFNDVSQVMLLNPLVKAMSTFLGL